MIDERFHARLRRLIVEYIIDGYRVLRKFPKDELYAMTAQGKRSIVSIFLNYTEGYARKSKRVTKNLYDIAYGSLQESIGVFYLAVQLNFIEPTDYKKLFVRKEEIGKMLWKTIEGLDEENSKNN